MIKKAYRRTLIETLDDFIDRKLNKVNGVNKPFKAIQKTEEYKKFQDMFKEALRDQGKWATDNISDILSSASVSDDLTALNPIQIDIIKGQITRDMPTMADLVSQFRVFNQLKGFFEYSAVQQYKRWGVLAKTDGTLKFTLTNAKYIAALTDRANYLLNKSSLDSTTLDQLISIISEGRLDGMTNDEVSQLISDRFDEISSSRADTITRTESANAMGMANHATAVENGAQTKSWIPAGGGNDEICGGNADAGEIPINQAFPSGDMYEPGHPNCECYTEAGLIDLDSIDLWDGE